MHLNTIWPTIEQAFAPLDDLGGDAMMRTVAELGLQAPWFPWFAAAALFGPEPFTISQYMRMFPYGLVRLNEERFAAAAQAGYMTPDGQGEYQATKAARMAAEQVLGAMYASIAHLQPVPDEQLRGLAGYLARLADASLAAPEPPNFLIAHKRKYIAVGQDAPLLGMVAQYINELTAYRDDAHLAAWQPLGVAGHAWEVLTTLWRGGPATLDALHEKLGARGVPAEVYAEDLHDLTAYGWVAEEAGVYRATPTGQKAREDAEALTEHYFFAPWACLSAAEQEDLLALATQLRDALQKDDADESLKTS